MPPGTQQVNERTHLLGHSEPIDRARSVFTNGARKAEASQSGLGQGEDVPYGDYAAIDWLRDLVCTACKVQELRI